MMRSMKETIFHILVSIRTANGLESIGRFYIGDNRDAAREIFRQLKGVPTVDDNTLLTLELVETANDLPVNVDMIGNTLEELSENCRVIVRECFRLVNL